MDVALQVSNVTITDQDTVYQVLHRACDAHHLDPRQYFILLRKVATPSEVWIPEEGAVFQPLITGYQVEMREKLIYHVHLDRPVNQTFGVSKPRVFGLTIRAQKDNFEGSLRVWITAVDKDGVALRKGIAAGDEILAVNKHVVRRLDPNSIEELLQKRDHLCLVMRTKRLSLPAWLQTLNQQGSQDSLNLSCGSGSTVDSHDEGAPHTPNPTYGAPGHPLPPLGGASGGPPCQPTPSGTAYGQQHAIGSKASPSVKYRPLVAKSLLAHAATRQRYSLPIIPATELAPSPDPGVSNGGASSVSAQSSPYHSVRNPLAQPLQASRISTSEPGVGMGEHGARAGGLKLSPCDRLERITYELLETERAYVEDLDSLIQKYLEPLSTSTHLPAQVSEGLLASTRAVLLFQRKFYEALQDAAGPEFLATKRFPNPSQLRSSLMLLGGVFVNQAPKFKLYSSFCAAHFKLQKVLVQSGCDPELQKFLLSRNLDRQHSSTLESYLIKPVQRVLRYPLFLTQLKALTSQGTPEHMQVSEALSKMEKIASYINDMQRIYEEHGSRFTQLQASLTDASISLDLSCLLMCGEVEWLNASDDAGANRRRSTSSHPAAMPCQCFVFQTAIVLLGQPRDRRKSSKDSQPLQRLIPLREVEVNGSDVGSSQHQHIWILIHMDASLKVEKIYHFANRRLELKMQFLKSVRKAGMALNRASSAGASSPCVRIRNKTHSSHETMVLKDPAPLVAPPMAFAHTHSAHSPLTARRTLSATNGALQMHTPADPCVVSSPDSGFLVPRNNPPSPRYLTTPGKGGVCPNGPDSATKRPGSYHSSQSDAGYGSNTELQTASRKLELMTGAHS